MPTHRNKIWTLKEHPGPIVATAVHAGHRLRPEVARAMALDDDSRLREEDPYTDAWADVGDGRLVVTHSRFEVDLNRPRDGAVYQTPADAWGLDVWKSPPAPGIVERSLDRYDGFYRALGDAIERRLAQHRVVVVLDLHSYNHRRCGPDAEVDDPESNPEVNIGTGSMDRERWSEVVDTFMAEMSEASQWHPGLDVRENVKFRGGYMSQWLHTTYPGRVCAIATEVKKIYMDEWTGMVDPGMHCRVGALLGRAATALRRLLGSR